jgi:hypothetical protein
MEGLLPWVCKNASLRAHKKTTLRARDTVAIIIKVKLHSDLTFDYSSGYQRP